jgi:hypothetical protein
MIKCDGKMNCWAFASMKLTIVALTIIVLKLWAAANTWVHSTNIWWFVGAFVVFAVFAGAGHGCCNLGPGKGVVKKTAGKRR